MKVFIVYTVTEDYELVHCTEIIGAFLDKRDAEYCFAKERLWTLCNGYDVEDVDTDTEFAAHDRSDAVYSRAVFIDEQELR